MKGAVRACWTFTNATMLQFFGALGGLRSQENTREDLKKNVDEERKTMMFLGTADERIQSHRLCGTFCVRRYKTGRMEVDQ